MLKSVLSTTALLVCVACVSSQQSVNIPNRPVGVGFRGGELVQNNGRKIEYAVGIFAEGGQYVVCTASLDERDMLGNRALRALRVTVNNQVLAAGIHWGPTYRGIESLEGQQAACRQTGVEVVADPEFGIRLAKNRFRRQRGR